MHYVDADLRPYPRGQQRHENFLVDRLVSARADYEVRWALLPQNRLTFTQSLKQGDAGAHVAALRRRLGLLGGNTFDKSLAAAITDYRRVHGLGNGSQADAALFASLNRGAQHYLDLIDRNVARAEAIPQDLPERFVFVDVAAQRMTMFEGQSAADTMRVIVGKRDMPTPSLAGYIRHAEVRPYWNLPADLVRENVASRVVAQGPGYLQRAGYQVLSDYSANARPVPARTVNWRAVSNGDQTVRVVQKPGPYNAMGDVKFMLPNELGIYLHDTPNTDLFENTKRLFSAGCVRLEDAERFSHWLFGADILSGVSAPSQRQDLENPVPVFIIYLTAWPDADGQLFREDIYGRDNDGFGRFTNAP